jgi:L-lactate dehydrogenase
MNTAPSSNRIAIIGAGHVGATTAFALMLRALVSEIVLIDRDAARAEAEAADIADANALARPAHIWAGTYADAASARIVVITAGAATHGDESRMSVLLRSAAIVTECVRALAHAGFGGIILVAANPVDVMAQVACRYSGLPASRVIGIGTLLDSSRLRQELGRAFDVAPGAVDATVLGEHGDSEVPAFSTARIGGLPLARFALGGEAFDEQAMAQSVRKAGYQIIAGKGYTSFGIATAIVRICEAILRNERSALPVSTLLTGEFGIKDVFLSLPCIIGAKGVERVLLPDLSKAEVTALRGSADAVRTAMARLGGD